MKTKYLHYLLIALLLLTVATAAVGDTNFTNVVASGDMSIGDDLSVTDDTTLTDDVGIGGNLTVTGSITSATATNVFSTTTYTEYLLVSTADVTPTLTSGVHLINQGSAQALILGTPTTGQNGMIWHLYSMTAQAHTITATTIGFNALNAAGDVCTLGGAMGDGITIVASAGEWWIINNVNCTLG